MDWMIFIIFLQIVGESFPISSSGHVVILEKFLVQKFGITILKTKFFDHFLHGPTILILMVLFYKEWFFPLKNLFCSSHKKRLLKIFLKIVGYLFITTFIGTVFWFLMKNKIGKQCWFYSNWTLLGGLIITAILLLLLFLKEKEKCALILSLSKDQARCTLRQAQDERTVKHFSSNYSKLTLKKVLILSFVQAFALLPGISRFASVYVASRLLKISPRRAFQFTFLMQFPIILPGFFLGLVNMIKTPGWKKIFSWQVNFTFLISTVVAFFALYCIKKLAYKKKLGLIFFYMMFPIGFLLYLIFI